MEKQDKEQVQQENGKKKPAKSRVPLMVAAAIVLIIGGGAGGLAIAGLDSERVYIENSTIEATPIALAPTVPGTLEQVYVAVGDTIQPNTVVARVGTELVKSTSGGLVITTDPDIGSNVSAGTSVVTMIDPSTLRVDGQLEEDKGLADVQVGDRAIFTVDAYPGITFDGVVSEVSPTSHASDVVFNVSDKREEQNFDVQVAYDISKYPQLKNGMSAKIWVYRN